MSQERGVADCGLIGLGVMGTNMALLLADCGFSVAVYNRTLDRVDNVRQLYEQRWHEACAASATPKPAELIGCDTVEKLLLSVKRAPGRVVFINIAHGTGVDSVLEQLQETMLLAPGDVLIDCGNEWFLETERRARLLWDRLQVHFIGMGVSGGYQAAREGPSFTLSGPRAAMDRIMPILESIAARPPHQGPCIGYFGEAAGLGHYVKMVHNGIEQAVLSAICELWDVMRHGLRLSDREAAAAYQQWNRGGPEDASTPLCGLLVNTYLLRITCEILTRRCRPSDELSSTGDEAKRTCLSLVEDTVVQDADATEGTGAWTVKECAELHVPCPSIQAAHVLRLVSAYRRERLEIEKAASVCGTAPPGVQIPPPSLAQLFEALCLSVVCSFVEGLTLLCRARERYGWQDSIDLKAVLHAWRGGCIIESEGVLDLLQSVLRDLGQHAHLLTHPDIAVILRAALPSVQRVVAYAALHGGVEVPTLSAGLFYVRAMMCTHLPTQLTAAQLDYFGHHQFQHVASPPPAHPEKGKHHVEWCEPVAPH